MDEISGGDVDLLLTESGEGSIQAQDDCFVKPIFIRPLRRSFLNSGNEARKNSTAEESILPLPDIQNDSKEIIKIQEGPAQRIAENSVPLPYKEPSWSGLLLSRYYFEVIKNGVFVENIDLGKPYIVVGRISTCDFMLEHPSISRFHCVIQQRVVVGEDDNDQPGIYVYDLDSTHGTYQNKYRVMPRKYNRLRVGHMLKFGGSSRMFILQGPSEDQDPTTEESVSELKALAEERKLKLKLEEISNNKSVGDTKEEIKEGSVDEGINWGMGEDAKDEEDGSDDEDRSKNPFASDNREIYIEDPKKTLRGWFEREGYDEPHYEVEEVKCGVFKCRVEIPIESSKIRGPLVCSIEHHGKKKDTIIQCAMEACKTLNKRGLLRQATHQSHERKRRDWSENDYYDSDEDDFLDRTGDIEKKRKLRKRELESSRSCMETYQSLTKQYNEVVLELGGIEKQLQHVEELKKRQESQLIAEVDDLDHFMTHLESQLPDKHKIVGWKLDLVKLQKEEARLRRLVNVSRPYGTPEIPSRDAQSCKDSSFLKADIKNVDKLFKTPKSNIAVLKVHDVFLEEDEDVKIKLPKVNCEDDLDNIRPIPYSKPQKKLDKYRELLARKRMARECLIPSSNPVEVLTHPLLEDVGPSKCEMEKEALDSAQDVAEVAAAPVELEPGTASSLLEFAKPTKPSSRKEVLPKGKPPKKSPFDFEEDYVEWAPPSGQTGDGRTSLNDRFGY